MRRGGRIVPRWAWLFIPRWSIPWVFLARRLVRGSRWRRGERVSLANLPGASGVVVDLVRPRPWLRKNNPDAAAEFPGPVAWWERWPLVHVQGGAECLGAVLLHNPDNLICLRRVTWTN